MNVNEMNEKLDFFLNNNIKIHIDLFDGTFLNGYVIRNSKKDVWIIQEDKIGQVFLFTKDIKILQQFRREKNEMGFKK